MASPSKIPAKRLSVAFVLADRFTLSAFANFVDVLRLAADEADIADADASDTAGAELLVATAVEAFGALDILVNNAGTILRAPAAEQGDDRRDPRS